LDLNGSEIQAAFNGSIGKVIGCHLYELGTDMCIFHVPFWGFHTFEQ